jgi:predicted kinase
LTKLLILQGLPASGKSTVAKAWVEQDRLHRARVNRDLFRRMLDDGVYVSGVTEGRVIQAEHGAIEALLSRGVSVVVDDTNLPRRTVRDLARIAAKLNTPGKPVEWEVNKSFLHVPLEECIKRDLHRKDMVGEKVIRDMHERYIANGSAFEFLDPDSLWGGNSPDIRPYVPPTNGPLAFIVDIDGTVAHRGTRNPFDESLVHQDTPNWPIIDLINYLNYSLGARLIFCSGRTAACYEETRAWLLRYVVDEVFALHMRPVGDTRKDSIVKAELFDKYIRDDFNVKYVFDDRNQVVEMWRSLGLTVLQVADGNF